MLAGEAPGTFFNKSEVIVEVLDDILKLKNGDAVLTAKGRGLILESENELMQAGK